MWARAQTLPPDPCEGSGSETIQNQGHLEDCTEKDNLEAGPDHIHLKNHTDTADTDQGLGIGFTIPETATLYIIQGGITPTIIHLRGSYHSPRRSCRRM